MIERESKLSIRMQCDFLGLPRSTYYHIPKGESKENLAIMQMMDKHIIEEPTAGVLTMQSMLRERNLLVSYERVRRLMR